MDNEKNMKKTIISTITRQYPQKANRPFSWAIIFITFQFFIMALLAPAHLQAAYTIHQGSDVEIQGDYAYIAVTGTSHSAADVIYITPPPPELPSGLRVIDISDPDSPEIIGGLNYSNSGILCLKVDGDLVYLSYSGSEGVKIIDISNPEDPEIKGTIKNVYAREMVIRDGYAYIADPDLGLVIYDVSDPETPKRLARLNLNGSVEDIAVQGNFAYLTYDDDDDVPRECGLHVCNISDPENPSLADTLVAGTALDSDVPSTGQMKIWMNADYAYLAKRSVIIIVDVSDPENPSREEIWHLPGLPPYGHIPSSEKLDGSGEYIYVTGDVDGQELLFVVNISDPVDPDPLGKVSIYKPNGGVAVQGDYACIVGWDGFQIIDISDPDDPSVVGKIKSTRPSGTSGTVGYDVYGYPYGYGYGSPYLPGYGRGYGYGYPFSGFGAPGGFGFGYPFSGFGASGGFGYGYPFSGFGTSGGFGFGYPFSGFGASGGFGYGYPFSGFGASGGFGFGYPFSGYDYIPYGNPYGGFSGSPYSGAYFGGPYPRFPL